MLDNKLIEDTLQQMSEYKENNKIYSKDCMKAWRSEHIMKSNYLRCNHHGMTEEEQRDFMFDINRLNNVNIPDFILECHNNTVQKEEVYYHYRDTVYIPKMEEILLNLVYKITDENSVERTIYDTTRYVMDDFRDYNFIKLYTSDWGELIIIENVYSYKSNHGCTITDIKRSNNYECKIPMLLEIDKKRENIRKEIKEKYSRKYLHSIRIPVDEIPENHQAVPLDQVYPLRAQNSYKTYDRTKIF